MFEQPLVSVIISNFNYAEYIETAISSVFAQSYEAIECIVVDDCSTDASHQVLKKLQMHYPNIIVKFKTVNEGQSGAILTGLALATGEYIILLDADDALLEHAIAYHIWAHLSLRIPVGFTSGDMIQVKRGRILTYASEHFAKFFREEYPKSAKHVRRVDAPASVGDNADEIDRILCYVEPTKSDIWPWSPTSGNCFRADALRLLSANPRLIKLRSCTDCYLLHGISAWSGSALINHPVAYYRIHENNGFAERGNLSRVRAYDVDKLIRSSNEAIELLVDHIFDHLASFIKLAESEDIFMEMVDTLDKIYPRIMRNGVSIATIKIVEYWEALYLQLGEPRLRYWLIRRCNPSQLNPVWRNDMIGNLVFYLWYLPSVRKKAGKSSC